MLIRSAEISCKASREPSQATTGHPGNEKEAKGLASLTGKVQRQDNNGNTRGITALGSGKQASDIIDSGRKACRFAFKIHCVTVL